jgi:hypothetical protein
MRASLLHQASTRLDRFVGAIETEHEPEADSRQPVCSRRRDGLLPPRQQTEQIADAIRISPLVVVPTEAL